MVTYGAMLIFLAVIIGLMVFKHKVFGFTFRVLLGLESVVIAVFIGSVLLISESRLLSHDFSPAHIETVLVKLLRLMNAYEALQMYVVSVTLGIFWIFALKYWSVALKFELAVNEEDITKRNNLVNALLFGGLVLISGLAITLFALVIVELNTFTTFKSTDIVFYLYCFCSFLPFFFYIDAIRRIKRTKIQNSTISLPTVVILSIAMIAEVIGTSLAVIFTQLNIWVFLGTMLSFIVAFGVLGFILFRIGILAVQSEQDEKQSFLLNANDEPLTEEDREVQGYVFGSFKSTFEGRTEKRGQKEMCEVVLEGRTGTARVTFNIQREDVQMISALMNKPR